MTTAVRPTRVLHLLPDLSPGGGQSVVLRSLRALDRQRFTPLVAVIDGPYDLADQFQAAGIEVIPLHGDDKQLVAGAVDTIRRFDVDVLHTHSDLDRRIGLAAAKKTGTPVVAHLHSMWVHLAPDPDASRLGAAKRRRLERQTVCHYVAASDAVRQAFAPFVHAPITVLPAPVDVDRFGRRDPDDRHFTRSLLRIPQSAPVAISVGRFAEGKGQRELVDAFAKTRAELADAELVLVGDGPERTSVEAWAHALGVAAHVHFVGNRSDVPELLDASDAFVFASESESFGVAVLEAMVAGLPVAAYRLEAFEEFVPDDAGRLVPPGDVDALAAALTALLSDPGTSWDAGARSRRAAAGHAPADAAATLAAVYDEVVTTKRRK